MDWKSLRGGIEVPWQLILNKKLTGNSPLRFSGKLRDAPPVSPRPKDLPCKRTISFAACSVLGCSS
jgi:hypothetical protein